jgi:predicted transcriptional regulator of viral defense system
VKGTIAMDYYEKIQEIADRHHGMVTSQMIKDESIPSVYLTRMVDKGALKRIDRGIYTTGEAVLDEYFLFYHKNQKIIFSFSSALFLHGLSDRIPYQMEVTLPNNYNSSHISDDVIIHKVLKKYYPIGRMMKQTMFGHEVACYDMERTICDLVRFRDTMDVEIFRKAVLSYKDHSDRNIHKLRQYANAFRISDKINELLDVI